jgi:hypothetical protein
MSRTRNLVLWIATYSLPFLAGSASAHPGHDFGDHGGLHIVTSPYHLAVLAVTGAALWWSARFIQHRISRRVIRACGIAALATAGVVWGFLS